MPREHRPLPERFQGAEELKFAGIECSLEGLQKEPAEQRRQNPDRQEKLGSAGNPPITARRRSAPGHDAMQVRVKLEVLSPTVQNGKEADFRTEVFGVRRDGFQSLGCGPEENAVDSLFVLESDRGNLFRHGEDDMKVRDLKKFGLAILKPLGSGEGLTFWAMAITARVEGVSLMTAFVAALHMAAESGCSAHFDGGHDAPLPGRHRRAMLFAVGFAITAEHVRHFQLRTIHEPRRSKML
jgi:hypothetical protein